MRSREIVGDLLGAAEESMVNSALAGLMATNSVSSESVQVKVCGSGVPPGVSLSIDVLGEPPVIVGL